MSDRRPLPTHRHARSDWSKPLRREDFIRKEGKSESAERTEKEYPGSEVLHEEQ